MDIYVFIVIGMIVGYLCGSIPFALIIGKLFYKVDVRKYGSKNLGSTNVARTLGVTAGAVVLILDLIKGGLPPFIMYKIAESSLSDHFPEQLKYLSIVYCVTGFFVALGHCHPLFANFKGGKAVACICGFLLFMNFRLWLVGILTYLIVVIISRIISLGSISAAIAVMIAQFIPFFRHCYLFRYNELSPDIIHTRIPLFVYTITLILLGLLLIYRHIGNINRLIHGEEKKFHIEKVTKKNK